MRPKRLYSNVLRSSIPALVALVVSVSLGATSTEAGAAQAQPSLGSYRICTDCAGAGDLSKYRYVLMNPWDHTRIPALRDANPAIKLFVYKDMASTRSWSCGGLVTGGVDYCWAQANHPGWFTHKGGAPFEWSGWPSHWQMNVGMPAYQNQWASNVIAELQAFGWDGVIIDNANMDQSGYKPFPYDEYATRQSYADATRGFLANVGPKIQDAGFLVIPNIQHSAAYLTESLWSDWIQFTSGATLEHYTRWGTGEYYIGDSGWEWSGQSLMKATQDAGKIFIGAFAGAMADTRAMRYARASFLLDWDGGPSALEFDPGATDPWSPEWTMDVGQPLASRYAVGAGWRREYSAGTVIANPSSSASVTFNLGTSYLMPDGSAVSSVTLSPMTGAVLRATASLPPPPPPSAPTNTEPPTISGTPKVGRTLTASTGTWTGSPTTYAYAWLRCDAAGASCSVIAAASAQSYKLTAADAGFRLRVRVTANNAAGSASAFSDPTAQVYAKGKAPEALSGEEQEEGGLISR